MPSSVDRIALMESTETVFTGALVNHLLSKGYIVMNCKQQANPVVEIFVIVEPNDCVNKPTNCQLFMLEMLFTFKNHVQNALLFWSYLITYLLFFCPAHLMTFDD